MNTNTHTRTPTLEHRYDTDISRSTFIHESREVGVMEAVVKSEPDKTTPKTTAVVEEVHNAAVV